METLKQQLDELIKHLENSDKLCNELIDLSSVYPFNEYEYIISHLLSSDVLSIEEYYELRRDYISRNLYLCIFEISAPRGFGEKWAEGQLKQLLPALEKPNKNLDPDYSGQYDFFLQPNIKIEVKASRAVDFNSSEPLYIKALSYNSDKQFDMNFQQIKTGCCDVFIWVAVWRDTIKYWVIPSYVVETNRYFSKGQHRGNVGEGQLHLNQDNIRSFDKYLVEPPDLEKRIRKAYKIQIQH